MHGSRVLDILFFDLGVHASVEVFELREIPPPFLRDLTAIPPQVSISVCEGDKSETHLRERHLKESAFLFAYSENTFKYYENIL